mgnify:CR=1 FL=1
MSSEITEKLENAEYNLEALKSYKAALEMVEDAIHDAQSEHPDYGHLPYPCTSEIEECISVVDEKIDTIQDILDRVDELE